jgi:hypothetical protein
MVLRYQPIESALNRLAPVCRAEAVARPLLREGADLSDVCDFREAPVVVILALS